MNIKTNLSKPLLLYINDLPSNLQAEEEYVQVIKRIRQLYVALSSDELPILMLSHGNNQPVIPEEWDLAIDIETKNISTWLDANLQKKLDHLNVSEVILAGFSTDKSINHAIESGLRSTCKITLAEDAHWTCPGNGVSPGSIVDQFNEKWKELENNNLKLSPTEYILERF